MKTVPTLCATATITGVSAVGLSIGRPDPSPYPPPSQKRKNNPLHDVPEGNHMPFPPLTSPSSHTSYVSDLPCSFPPAIPSHLASRRGSHDGEHYPQRMRRMTSGDAPAHLHPVTTSGRPSLALDDCNQLDPGLTVRPRSSWIRRLSIISSISYSSSRASSPLPVSPSVSCSNGSMAFSHDGSTAPIIGTRATKPLPPNKLVKRSSSFQTADGLTSQDTGSRFPSLRRPATSHQRRANLQRQRNFLGAPAETSRDHDFPPLRQQVQQPHYRQYFVPKISKEGTMPMKRGSGGEAKSIKRIFPDGKHAPTLLVAASVTATPLEIDDSTSQDGESVDLGSRPTTPFESGYTTPSPPRSSPSVEDVANENGAPTQPEHGRKLRHSFSITDLFSASANAKKIRSVKHVDGKLVRKSGRRVSSAPFYTIANKEIMYCDDAAMPVNSRDFSDPVAIPCEVRSSPINRGYEVEYSSESDDFTPLPFISRSDPIDLDVKDDELPSHSLQQDGETLVSTSYRDLPPSPTLPVGRPSRHSMAPSEQASTLVGSDNEARGVGSGDDDDTDLQSETVFDSLRTRGTRSTSGARGPRIETIFDESPPQPSKHKVTNLRDLLSKGTFRDPVDLKGDLSITEEDESMSTPVRTAIPEPRGSDSPTTFRSRGAPFYGGNIPSSPPDGPKPLNLGTLEWDTPATEDDGRWSFDDDNDDNFWSTENSKPLVNSLGISISPTCASQFLGPSSSPLSATSQQLGNDHADRDARSSIFDWSEQQPPDKSPGNRTPPRPRTVHGKKDADHRGSRSIGRRAPSALHARSQSVPVVPDLSGKRSPVVTNKFGTWGVGSKGVTEDWNDDFDFSDFDTPREPGREGEEKRVDSGVSMIVPQNIRDQQTSVLANIGLLREWGLLIEELKELRVRAVNLGLLEGPSAGVFDEVDAMINLADQETDEPILPPRLPSPPSSPGLDMGAFDEEPTHPIIHGRSRRKSGLSLNDDDQNQIRTVLAGAGRARRKSILTPNDDIFSAPLPKVVETPSTPQNNPPKSAPVTTRPRKNSEAVARSVIEALQKKRNLAGSSDLQPTTQQSKVPFDTATLKHIVPYVNGLMRKVKEAIREKEGLYSSPQQSRSEEPAFRKIFKEPPDSSPSRKACRSRQNHGPVLRDDGFTVTEKDLATQMKVMTVM